jgi:hypothetical protein
MKTLTESELRQAIRALGLPDNLPDQILAAVPDVPEHSNAAPRFEAAHIAYYLGSLLIIGAMGWFITSAWDGLSGLTLTAIALAYALVFGAAGSFLWKRPATRIPGGLLTAVAVCMTPLAVYGIERQLGWWPSTNPGSYANFHPYINGSWIVMEIATILVAAIALKFIRFPFILAPAAYALWYMSMDATAFFFGHSWNFHQECWISVGFGVVMLAVGYFADGYRDADFSFWFYLFGLLCFSGGLSLLGNGSQLGKAVYCLIHLGLIVLSIVLQRRAFLVFGGLGVFAYLADEATSFFRNSFGFTLGLTLIGIVFIAAGILYKKNEAALTEALSPLIPERIRHRHEGLPA